MGGGITWFAKSLVEGLPVLIVVVGGMALCFVKMKVSPRASAWALGGGGVLLLHFLVGRLWGAFGVARLYGSGGAGPLMAAAVSFLLNVLLAAGLGVLFYAVFVGRNDAKV
jgi:hypothetical protein